ncbi:hypothetical protein HOLleu_43239 [Holothuria leucospilota]|uniref:Folate receptor-like domain-containing protein n=1 Tax=Holothuria leucospilota TaxID=206669 RepID=A0A9Q1BAW4_HOLLE|nr:hypothetical protein HOLleu_43239 [Holothuria leucospilota]
MKNCTWYKEESCCTQIEIDETFKNMKPLQGSTPACQRHVNYLMCYICSPHQYIFYIYQKLTVCEEFCDAILTHCQDAILKGSRIKDLHSNGAQFCKSRNLEVDRKENGNCFYFDETEDNTLGSSGSFISQVGILSLTILCFLIQLSVAGLY